MQNFTHGMSGCSTRLADQKLEVRIEQCGRWRLRFVAASGERLRASSMIARNHTPNGTVAAASITSTVHCSNPVATEEL